MDRIRTGSLQIPKKNSVFAAREEAFAIGREGESMWQRRVGNLTGGNGQRSLNLAGFSVEQKEMVHT